MEDAGPAAPRRAWGCQPHAPRAAQARGPLWRVPKWHRAEMPAGRRCQLQPGSEPAGSDAKAGQRSPAPGQSDVRQAPGSGDDGHRAPTRPRVLQGTAVCHGHGATPCPDSVSQRLIAWHHPTGWPRETPVCAPQVPPPRVPAPRPRPVALQRLRGGRRVPGSRRARGSVWALIKRAVVMNELVRRVCMTMELPNYGF